VVSTVAIDTESRGSVGWWMNFCWQKLKADQPRFDLLEAYRLGNPPLPDSLPASLKAATRQMIRMSMLTAGDLVVQAMVERMNVRSIRTAVADDDIGDAVALQAWKDAGCPAIQADVHRAMAGMSLGYVAVSMGADDKPIATYEDPRQMTHVPDPLNPLSPQAAWKLYHDDVAGRDYAVLRLPGEKWVASRQVKSKAVRIGIDGRPRPVVSFVPSQFTLHPLKGTPEADGFEDQEMLSERFDVQDTFVVPFPNRDGVGEFELHLNHLDQISHVILQGVVIATFQAFRQRALKASGPDTKPLDTVDNEGNPVDLNELLSADPGALWQMPLGWEIWESGTVDMTGILQLAKDAIQRFASVTRTPFSMFSSDATNQSAEGAQLNREGLIFKADDRKTICSPRWARVESLLLLLLGDSERGDPSKITIDWSPSERYSLAEMAQADSQAVSLPDEQKWQRIWHMTPDEITTAQTQMAAQRFRDAALAASQQPANVQPAT
jgi:hypothetical protein